ncbi:MAG: hypothetical protein IKH11_00755, partial [Bacteroidales bacterium]|nr:hypothetical protein [Bacteroidales bacterium]
LQQFDYYITDTPSSYSWTKASTFRTATVSADDVTYYNGLGFPVQSWNTGSCAGYDMGKPFTYDALMRENREWLPMPFEQMGETEDEWAGFYIPTEDRVLSYYQANYSVEPDPDDDPVPVRPFSDKRYEFSTAGRLLSETLPGEQYHLHPVTYDYLAGVIDGRAVLGVKTTDGDGRESIEWKDYEDRVVAEDRRIGNNTARTLYRYDWRGNLTQVVTPEGNCYSYTYDQYSRVASRTVSGKAVETFTYDAIDRITSSQDGNQRAGGVTIRYYYDNIGNLTYKKAEKNNVLRTLEEYSYSLYSSLKTSEKFYLLTDDGWVSNTDYLSRSYSYDDEERVNGVVETDSGQSYTLTSDYDYDLQGNLIRADETCDPSFGTSVDIRTEKVYDSRSKILGETVEVGNVTRSDVAYSYDELGRLAVKYYGTGSGRISESSVYSIQGWPSYVGGSLLTQSYGYESGPNPSWTGNISRWGWHHLATAAENTTYPSKSESFTYDALDRLTGSAMTSGGQSAGNCWSERNISYDLDGNILHLDRYQDVSATPSTTLNFTYSGNHRSGWTYDSNGNITGDPLRGFEIRYNLLNLACGVRIPGPGGGTELSETKYYADGTRAGVVDANSGAWLSRYRGSLIYSGENGEEDLEGIQTADGYIDCSNGISNAQMQYFIRDHLGSVRVIATDRNNVISRTDYLPYGVRMTGSGLTESGTDRSAWFGFSGKENEMWNGQASTPHWLRGERYQHFGARAYDPATCTFMQVDPMAEKYYGISPYAYCAGNPLNLLDKLGDSPLKVFKTVYHIGKKAYKAYRKAETFRLGVAVAEEAYSIVDDVNTLTDEDATTFQKGLAVFDLATGFGEEAKAGMKMLGVSERVFTGTSRGALKKSMQKLNGGVAPAGKQAHHMLPWEFRNDFDKAGIDINDPQYGMWLDTHEHLSKHKEYNKQWADFFQIAEDNNKQLTVDDIV